MRTRLRSPCPWRRLTCVATAPTLPPRRPAPEPRPARARRHGRWRTETWPGRFGRGAGERCPRVEPEGGWQKSEYYRGALSVGWRRSSDHRTFARMRLGKKLLPLVVVLTGVHAQDRSVDWPVYGGN